MLASTLALTAAQIGILLLLFVASLGTPAALGLAFDQRAAGVAAAVLGLPGVNLASQTVQNGAALMFPTWVRPASGPRGVEAMGMGLLSTTFALTLAGTLLALPGALAAALLWALRPSLGVWAVVPAAALLTVGVALEMRPVHAGLPRRRPLSAAPRARCTRPPCAVRPAGRTGLTDAPPLVRYLPGADSASLPHPYLEPS